MAMVKYTYFTPEGKVGRTSTYPEGFAYESIGSRVASGFDCTTRIVDDGKGNRWPVVTFVNCFGTLFCLYEFED